MKARYVKTIYQNPDNGFCVYVYQTMEGDVPPAAKSTYYKGEGCEFTATGSKLPATSAIEVELNGRWIAGKRGLQLAVDSFSEILPQTIEGIRGYLSSGLIKGIGEKTAELITDRFGTDTFKIMDREPKKLLEIRGITEKKLQVIMSSYLESNAIRDLSAYLMPFHITERKVIKIYEEYGAEALNVVKNNPFCLCKISGFGFLTVDEIAKANRCRLNDPLRIEGCIDYCMDQMMQDGHLYGEKNTFGEMVYQQLNQGYVQEVVTRQEVGQTIYQLALSKKLVVEEGAIYPSFHYRYEEETAEKIAEMLMTDGNVKKDCQELIEKAQKDLGILLSEKQVSAVRMVFSNPVSIITGGPGTGKTTVQKVILYVYEKLGGKKAMLMAPTGRASRRMAESTGHPGACTMHSALGFTGEQEYPGTPEPLDTDLEILDEQSMTDMHLAHSLFQATRKGTRVVLIGDVNQLPSVGPGNVFRELIRCGAVPVTVLDMVFRQGANSRIARNAHLMQENSTALEYGTDFVYQPAASDEEAATLIEEIYLREAAIHGVMNVQILTPYRKRGDSSVNALNDRLRDKVNPKKPGEITMTVAGKEYRTGDKIIQNKNRGEISNGDVGNIREIRMDGDGFKTAVLSFGEDRTVEYTAEEMEMVEHSYATTVHKSQGSEYPVVILPWLPMFFKMLRRNILYTGITRAKEKCYIIGSRRSVAQAIHSQKDDCRNSRLGERILKKLKEKQDEKTAS